MKNKALYPGTFDPITLGHLWVIDEATHIFDKVVVAVADNPEKRGKTMFSVEERVAMVKESCFGLDGIEVITYAGEYAPMFTARFAKSIGATHLIRGIRNEADFTAEQAIRHINQDICPEVKTVFMVPPRDLSEVSSSMVKGLVGFQGWRDVVSKYVPDCVVKRFQARRLGADEVMLRLGTSPSYAQAAKTFLDRAYAYGVSARVSVDHIEHLNPRWYHDMRHIKECLDLLKLTVSDRRISPSIFDEMAAALWFHDCVYDPKASDNEKRSAKEFERFAKDINPSVVFSSVKQMIEATKDHKFDDHKVNIVNDIDMAILGTDKSRFDQYESDIRAEYRHIPDDVFYPARRQFIMEWLAKGVYHTAMFKSMFRDKMIVNLQLLLATKEYARHE